MYPKEIAEFLKKSKAKIGDDVSIEVEGETLTGTLMPRIEAGSRTAIILKLKNGYNLGVEFNQRMKISKLKQEKSKIEREQKETKEKEHFDPDKKTILILHTGGTIASKVDYRTGGVIASYSPEDLLSMFPELGKIANIKAKLVRNMWSEDLNQKHYTLISKEIAHAIKTEKIDGIIISHGTDTLHYTSAALSFALENLPIPVMLVGSQRSSDRASSDAFLNFISAAFFISNSNFKGVGVCMHETTNDSTCLVHSGTKARKCHSSRRDAFRSVNASPIARIDFKNKKIEFLHKQNREENEEKKEFKLLEKFDESVALLKVHPGFNSKIVELLAKQGCKGILFEGTGLGHLPINEIDEFTKKNKQLYKTIEKFNSRGGITAIATQTIFGRTNLNVYSTGRDLQKIGCISCEDMTPETAFIKLSWLLGNFDAKTAKALMQKDLRGEVSERTNV